jgi:ATP/maltotriose-dependent transcriptional regulator MalT/DNA-binding SARP family transcriptional activator
VREDPQEARIARPALEGRLAIALQTGSLLIVADAGYGKTMALQGALERTKLTAAWVRCTESDDAGALMDRVMGALRRALPGAIDVFEERLLMPGGRIEPEAVAAQVAAHLEAVLVEPLALVIDDAEHLRADPGACAVVSTLLQDGGALRLAIASRTPLAIRAARLEAAGRLTITGSADLVFDAEESTELLRRRRGSEPTEHEVDAVLDATEGWPLGVAAAALAGVRGLAGPAGATERRAFDFLAEEVLDSLPTDLQRRLEDSAIPAELDQVTLPALNLDDAFLDEVRERGLFLNASGTGAARYHPLFRALLLRRGAPHADAELHARLGAALQAAGRPGQAVDHWLAARRPGEAASAIAQAGAMLVRTAPERVIAWLEQLPATERARPDLALLEGAIVHAGGTEPDRAIALLRKAIEGFEGDPIFEWVGRFLLADALIWSGSPAEVPPLAHGFEDSQTPAAPATALTAVVALAQTGRIEEAQQLAERVHAHPEGEAWKQRTAWQGLFIHLPAGRLDDALAAVDDDLRGFPTEQPHMSLAYPLAYRAQVLEERGEEDQAVVAAEACEAEVARAALGGMVLAIVRARRAHYLARLGRLGEAEAEIESSEMAIVHSWWRGELELARATIAAARGDAASARAAADRALAALQAAPDYERARAAAWLAPLLAGIGLSARARELVDDTLATLAPHVSPARLMALRAWLRHSAGEDASDDLARALETAGDQAHYLLRREWAHIEPLLGSAIEQGALDPARTVAAIAAAFPAGEAVLPLTRHSSAAVRAAAATAAAAAGSPAAAARLAELAKDPDPQVAQVAATAAEAARRRPPALALQILGPFTVRRGAWTVDDAAWDRKVAQRVVRLLLVNHPRPVPEDVLLEALWPERPAASGRRSLHVAVSSARAALDAAGSDASLIQAASGGYRLALSERDVVDADVFVQAAARALSTGGRRQLERAAELWTGDPLPEERYADWATEYRERLTDRYAEVLAALADACETGGDRSAALAAARRLVELDPLDESAHRRVMTAYARAGRRAHALRQFLECRKRLVEELGLEPSEATVALQRRILVGETP